MNKNNNEYANRHLSKNDKVISRIIKKYGKCNLHPRKKYFELLISSIIGQQLSLKSAAAINKRFFSFFNNKPNPEDVLKTSDKQLRSLGLSNAKTKYVKDLCDKLHNKEISLRGISKLSDEEVIAELTKVKGIGEWTAHMFLIFTLARSNILPTGDLGIKKAIMLNYGYKSLPDEDEVENLSRKMKWAPYNSYAALYMWKSIDAQK